MPTTILVVDDHDAVRTALRQWLEVVFPQSRVVEACNGEQAIALAATCSLQLVVMDIGLPCMSGIEATRRIKAAAPGAPIVILSMHEDQAYRADAMDAGVSAYVPKRKMRTELLPTLVELLANEDQGRSQGSEPHPGVGEWRI
jgi:DNA-binding NarL/FixJ family response regulator